MKIQNIYSPNFDKKKRSINSIKVIVIHYTGMQSEGESLKRLCNPKSKVSSHFLINRNGKIYRLVSENKIAWHAGKSKWRSFKNLNKNSLGIELVNKGHQFGYQSFKKKQLYSLVKICKILVKKYKINKINLVGHSDIAPLRKIDPGEKFPWKELAKKNLGIWHDFKSEKLRKFRKLKVLKSEEKKLFFINLKKIGYHFKSDKKLLSKKCIKAFQRRYRPELINGIIDKECQNIAQNLSKKV